MKICKESNQRGRCRSHDAAMEKGKEENKEEEEGSREEREKLFYFLLYYENENYQNYKAIYIYKIYNIRHPPQAGGGIIHSLNKRDLKCVGGKILVSTSANWF